MKNSAVATYAFTVSPTTGTCTLDFLKKTLLKYFKREKKRIRIYAYCLEMGEQGDHPHTHVLLTFDEPRRRDIVLRSIKGFFIRELNHPDTRWFIKLTLANNPYHFLVRYMTKEGIEYVNAGYDVDKLKKKAQTLAAKQDALYAESKTHKTLTRMMFAILYESYITNGMIEPIVPRDVTNGLGEVVGREGCTSEYMWRVIGLLRLDHYNWTGVVWAATKYKALMETVSMTAGHCYFTEVNYVVQL